MDNKIYADSFNVLTGLVDVKVDFMTTGLTWTKEGKPIVGDPEIAQRVTLSLPLAKDLAHKLSEMVEDYEKKFGTILDLGEVQKQIAQGK